MPRHLDVNRLFFPLLLTVLASIVRCSLQTLPPKLVVTPICCKVNSKTRIIVSIIEDVLCKLQISNLYAKHVELTSD